ncbi:MAG: RDD family protein [Chitinophagaceae bacterium]
MNTILITTTQNIELEYDLASLGERLVGFLIDFLIISAYLIVLSVVFAILSSVIFAGRRQWIVIVFYLPIYFYNLASEIFMNGQSVGKKVMKMKVISLDGSQPSLGQYLIRWVFRVIDIPLGALICIAATDRKQRLGDMVAGTAIIKTEPRIQFQQTLYVPNRLVDYKVTFPEVTSLGDHDMQLIKEVVIKVNNSGNHNIATQAAQKIMQLLQIQSDMEPILFLKVLLADYNYLTSRD